MEPTYEICILFGLVMNPSHATYISFSGHHHLHRPIPSFSPRILHFYSSSRHRGKRPQKMFWEDVRSPVFMNSVDDNIHDDTSVQQDHGHNTSTKLLSPAYSDTQALRGSRQISVKGSFPASTTLDILTSDATPSPWDSTLGNWIVRGTVGKGSFTTVNAAKHTVTGEAGAAKFMVRTQETQKAIAQEIDILKSLPNHPQILQFHDVQYERGEKWFCAPSDEDDERHSFKARPKKVAIIYSPFARATITECLNDLSISLRLVAFCELIQGVNALHRTSFIHRDIKPNYGQAVHAVACEPKPGLVGTVPYLAPEMELRTYGPSVDIWAYGVAGLQLFVTAGTLRWKNVSHERNKFKLVMTALRDEPADSKFSEALEGTLRVVDFRLSYSVIHGWIADVFYKRWLLQITANTTAIAVESINTC
ncbi:kinase-like domain-containing protein [Leptodontidium sp. MPI-SDFR-AT-0119]|nr:kinase-like domain-containing protein [Leptodontidium sp. MPI-SDFR-AT-0119]